MKNNFDLASMSTSWVNGVEVRNIDKRISDAFELHTTHSFDKGQLLRLSQLFRDITVIIEDHEKQVIEDFKKMLIEKVNAVPRSSWDTEPLHVVLTILKELDENS